MKITSQSYVKNIMTLPMKTIKSVLKVCHINHHQYCSSIYLTNSDTSDNVCLNLQNCCSSIRDNIYSSITCSSGLDINVCPIPVKTDIGQVDLVLRLSDGTSEKIIDFQTCRYDGQIYFHWYKILGLLYKRALFDLQFVSNLF